MDLVESSSDLKILAVNVMYLGRFGFFRVLGRRSETKLTRSDSRKKDPPPTARVVRFRSNLPGGSSWRLSWTPLINAMLQFLDIYRYRCELHSELIHYSEKEKEEGKLQCLK